MDKRVTGLYPTKNFKLVLEFSNDEYKFVECGTVQWSNGVDLDPDVLYERSKPLDELNLV